MRLLTSMVATVALVGCVGGIEDVPEPKEEPTDPTTEPPVNDTAAREAKMLYDTNVYPIVKAKCISCHSFAGPVSNSSGFVTDTVDNARATVISFVSVMGDSTLAGAPIVTKIPPAPNPTPSHAALSYTTDELGKFDAWLAKELEAKTAPTDPNMPPSESPADAQKRVMGEWSGCQSLELFEQAQMIAWGSVAANGSACSSCHADGTFGFVAATTADPVFFKYITEDKYFMLQYFAVDLSGGTLPDGKLNAKMKVNEITFEAVGLGKPPHNDHPRFDPKNNPGMTALKAYYDLVAARRDAKTCDAPRLKNL